MKIAEIVLAAVIVVVLGSIFGLTFSHAIDREEVADCLTLKRQSVTFQAHFFLAEWQDEMCRAHGIVIDAPLGNPYGSK